jgi:hypothetical protein
LLPGVAVIGEEALPDYYAILQVHPEA